ncbi:MAG TPA: transposase [Gammaproteobacteria bacterium]|nr:transposase [Gammaproteobacteria bacterium]
MPRANRYFLPGHVWHITHRCHKQEFLLKFLRDRRRWRHWLFESRKRYGLCVLNYTVTSNHIHLLVRDRGNGEIARSLQLIAGRTAQEFNQRKGRKGAFWEDRYHATAVDTDRYLARCMTYIDLNMVRAGVVRHPEEWPLCGYREIQHPPARYTVIDPSALLELFGLSDMADLQRTCREWVDDALRGAPPRREPAWSESLAVGGPQFIEAVKHRLGRQAVHRQAIHGDGAMALREPLPSYGTDSVPEMARLSGDNAVQIG